MKSPTEALRGLFSRQNSPATSHLTAPAEALALPALLLRAEQIAASLTAGTHGRRRAGEGESFWQFRPYHSGEPATAIDWRQSARSPAENTLWVRERERENAQSLLVWCDPSASMNWRSTHQLPTKQDHARLCALALVGAALRGGERTGLLTGPEAGRTFTGRHALERLGQNLLHPRETEPDLPDLHTLPPRTDLIFISDFLWEAEKTEALLKLCASTPARIHLLCVLDPAELSLTTTGRVRFTGLEGGTLTLPATESLGPAYEHAMTTHLNTLRHTANRHQAPFLLHTTSQNPLPTLLALHLSMGSAQ